MDVIILAAGRGGRLTGIAPPYFKPLLPVGGVPLITNCIRVLDPWRGGVINKVTVVVAPENALPISQLLAGDDVEYVVQAKPKGPGESLLRGLQVGSSQRVMVLLGDNTVTAADISMMIKTSTHVIGVKRLPTAASLQFTYWNYEYQMWVEKIQHTNPREDSIEAWCGPLIINRELATDLYNDLINRGHRINGEYPIGPYLDTIAPSAARVHVSCTDIGHIEYWRSENHGNG